MAAWSPFFLSRIVVLALLAFSPWIQGSANWREQFWLTLGTMFALLLLLFDVLDRMLRKAPQETLRMPWASVAVLTVACFAWLQSLPLFPIDGSSSLSPNSVQIQRWFLGYPNPKIAEMLKVEDVGMPTPTAAIDFPERKLAISIEPLHTRAAVPAMVMSAVMIWLGAVGFKEQRWQLALMIMMTILGIIVGLLGMIDILSWNRAVYQIVPGGSTFGVFVSKNCAGGFLAICLAASLGLSTWAFNRPRQKDHRYAYAGESPALRIMRVFEDTLAQLTTTQIACVIANAMIVAFIIGSNSRGAMASAAAAGFVVLLIGRLSSHSMGRWIFATIVIILCLTFAVFFSLETKATERFAELTSSEALENEVKQGRLYIWGIALKTFGWFWATGSGLGTFHFAHHPFQSPITNYWYYHAESLYLQGLVDLGWIAGGLALALIWIGYRAVAQVGATPPNVRAKAKEVRLMFEPIYAMGIALIVSQFLHAFVDFTLIIPALFLPAGLMFGSLLGAASERKRIDREIQASSLEHVVERQGSSTSEQVVHSSRYKPAEHSESSKNSPSRIKFSAPSISRPSTASENASGNRVKVWLGGIALVLSSVLMLSGLASIDALRLVKKMERWTIENGKQTLPLASLSAYLAGIWENTWMPAGRVRIANVPDALRMMGDSMLSEHRLAKAEQLERTKKLDPKQASDSSQPLITRIEMVDKARQLAESKPPRAFDEIELKLLLGDEKQWLRWSKSRDFFERAQLNSPLDWRLAWMRILSDDRIDLRQWNGWMERFELLSQNDPDLQFKLGLLVRMATQDRARSEEIWKKMLSLSYHSIGTVAAVLARDTPDGEIPIDLFPQDPSWLQLVQSDPFTQLRFPKTHERIWQRIEEIALAMPSNLPERPRLLASVAGHLGNTEKELEYLEQAVRQNPLSRGLRLQWVNRLTDTGDLRNALEQAEFVLSMAPEDPHADAVVKGLQDRIKKSQELPPLPQ